ncbi:MAG TPA: SRPBCC family protein [Pirellulales bacterium]|nr:SRPBCC family protein [Pirellulales bacterium]
MSQSATAGLAMEPLDFQTEHRPAKTTNVSGMERLASAVAGGVLAGWSLVGGRPRLLPLAIGGSLLYRGISGHCSLYRALSINSARSASPAVGVRARHGCKVEHRLAILRPADELYRSWRDVANLPRILRHVVRVEAIDERRSHWAAQAPLGATLEWDAEIINEREPELIAWRSLSGSQVDTAGSIHFQPLTHGRGTLVTVSLKYEPPGGKLTAALAEWTGAGLESRIKEDLRRFKNLAEAGEIPTIEGQPHG